MNIALYRRYRPDTFATVIGQEQVTRPLMAAVDAGRINHAYLFSGPRGCGKTTCARIMARCLNCAEGPTSSPCGKCPSCVELATGASGSLDVVEIDAASHNGVDDARDLRERAAFAPVRDRFKIFILDEAHMVTSQGFNALLKLVEEPPEHVKFIFATTEPEKVIGTIRSRTHHYPFRLVAPEILRDFLGDLCDQENIVADEGVLELVIRAGGGSVRDSLSVLDQLMAGAKEGKLDYQTAVGLLGYTDSALLQQVVDAIIERDATALFNQLENVIESGLDPRRFLEDLLLRLRDLLLLGFTGAEISNLAALPQAQLEYMRQQVQRWNPADISRAADLTAATIGQMTGTVAPRLQIELLGARLLAAGGQVNPAGNMSIPSGDNRLGQGDAANLTPAAAAAPVPPTVSAALPAPAVAANPPSAAVATKAATPSAPLGADIEASMAAARAALAASRPQRAAENKPSIPPSTVESTPQKPPLPMQNPVVETENADLASITVPVVAKDKVRSEVPQWELKARIGWPRFLSLIEEKDPKLFCVLNLVAEPRFAAPNKIEISTKDEAAQGILREQYRLLQSVTEIIYPASEIQIADNYQPQKPLAVGFYQALEKIKAESDLASAWIGEKTVDSADADTQAMANKAGEHEANEENTTQLGISPQPIAAPPIAEMEPYAEGEDIQLTDEDREFSPVLESAPATEVESSLNEKEPPALDWILPAPQAEPPAEKTSSLKDALAAEMTAQKAMEPEVKKTLETPIETNAPEWGSSDEPAVTILAEEDEISFDDEDAKPASADIEQVLKQVLKAKKIEEINLKE